VVVDGVNQIPHFESSQAKDPDILIVKDTNGKLISATRQTKQPASIQKSISSQRGNAYGIITSDDLDNEKLALIKMGTHAS
jgi:hypothetical protein